MGIQVGGRIFSNNHTITMPDKSGTLATLDDIPEQSEGGGTSAYLIWTAILNQSGTDAPVAEVLENTLGDDVVITRQGEGNYTFTLPSAVPKNRIFIPGFTVWIDGAGSTAIPITDQGSMTGYVMAYGTGGANITSVSLNFLTTGLLAAEMNELLQQFPFEFRIYP
jgi:hypothetical protein